MAASRSIVGRVLNAIFYVVRTGCQWRQLPRDFPKWKSVYTIFWRWRQAYNGLDATKQRCLLHLLRELHGLREKVPANCVKRHLEPLIALFQAAIALAKDRDHLSDETYAKQCDAILLLNLFRVQFGNG